MAPITFNPENPTPARAFTQTSSNPFAQSLIGYANDLYDRYNQHVGEMKAGGNTNALKQADQDFTGLNNSLKSGLDQILPLIEQGKFGQSDQKVLQQYLGGDPMAVQAVNERISGMGQLDKQNQQLTDFRNQVEQQQFGGHGLSLSDALTSTGGDIGNLNQFLGQQEAQTFNTQLKPLIEMALGSQGLSNSGAQVELQSKALSQLDQTRQQSMMQAALGARGQIQGLQQSQILGDIGSSQQMLNNQFDLQRASITMQFQQQLENQREQLAQQLASRQGGGGSGLGGILGMGGGSLLGAGVGFVAGGPAGAMMGAQLGGALGGSAGNYADPNQNYGSIAGIPSLFGAGSNFFSNSSSSQSNQQPRTGTITNGQFSGWSPYQKTSPYTGIPSY